MAEHTVFFLCPLSEAPRNLLHSDQPSKEDLIITLGGFHSEARLANDWFFSSNRFSEFLSVSLHIPVICYLDVQWVAGNLNAHNPKERKDSIRPLHCGLTRPSTIYSESFSTSTKWEYLCVYFCEDSWKCIQCQKT